MVVRARSLRYLFQRQVVSVEEVESTPPLSSVEWGAETMRIRPNGPDGIRPHGGFTIRGDTKTICRDELLLTMVTAREARGVGGVSPVVCGKADGHRSHVFWVIFVREER